MQVHNPQKSDHACSTCSESFPNIETYKQHYKSDYHRYNIKRKMVKLPPVSLQQFSTKLHEIKNAAPVQFVCNQCRKTFASAKTLNQHVQSKGHNPNAMTETRQKIERTPLPFAKNSSRCLFCGAGQGSLELNLQHMSSTHSFFVAQTEFCKNLGGLVEYLQEKIEVGNMCITCENKGVRDFQSADAVRKHMADRGHSFMKTDAGFEEYEKYYDFSRLFQQKLKEQEHTVPGIQYQKVKVLVDGEEAAADGEDEEWEDESGSEDEEEEQGEWQDIAQEQQQGQQANPKEQKKKKTKTYMIMKPTLTANDELLLPNGKLLGHRKYRHIYKQFVRMPFGFSNHLKMLGNAEHCTALMAMETRRQLVELVKGEKVMQIGFKRQKKNALLVGITNNKVLQQHYRCSTP